MNARKRLVVVLGGSGFIGRHFVDKTPKDVHLRILSPQKHPSTENIQWIQGDFLKSDFDFDALLKDADAIIHLARPSANNSQARIRISKKTALANNRLLKARKKIGSPHLIAMHGSLSYGDCGDTLVTCETEVKPTGFAAAYATGEKPIREAMGEGGITIIRAPWVLGDGSWFNQLYKYGKNSPIFSKQPVWMSIVEVNSLAKQTWEILSQGKMGVVHPRLSGRLLQSDFARFVGQIRGVKTSRIGYFRFLFEYDEMTRKSIQASIRLQDGNGDFSESAEAVDALKASLQEILHSDFS
jgi:nucleoside-diphosphate-sugar epimerase